MKTLPLVFPFILLSTSLSAQSSPYSNSIERWPLRPPALSRSHVPVKPSSISSQKNLVGGERLRSPNASQPSLDASGIFVEVPLYNSGGFEAEAIAAADVNGDGIPDVVVANSCASNGECGSNGSVDVLLGNGDGNFQTAVSYSSGGVGPFSLAVGDVNNDNKVDIVVVNLFSSTVGVLLGNGDGTFQSPITYSSGGDQAVSVAVKDVNGDNKPDIIVANQCASSSGCGGGSVNILFGNGDGTFQAGPSYGSGGYFAESVAVDDLNGDGNPDIVVVDFCASSSSCSLGGVVGVLMNNGNGTFQSAVSYNSGGDQPLFVTIADVNRDKKPDVIVANSCVNCAESAEGSIGVLLGNGNGTLRNAVAYDSGGLTAVSVAITDVNNDGNPDLLVANTSGETTDNSTLGVLLGNGNGTFKAPASYNLAGYSAESIVFADVNGDDKTDALVSNFYQYVCNLCAPGAISVALGNGDGTFQAAPIYLADGVNNGSAAAADLNEDGSLDLVIANECPLSGACTDGIVTVLLGNGKGAFRSPVSYSSGAAEADSVAIADLNHDGRKDLVVANFCSSNDCNSGSVGVLLGNGDGTFQAAVTYDSGGYGATSIAVADVNGDNIPDLIVANSCISNSNCSTGAVDVLLGNGDGTFQAAVSYKSGGILAQSVVVADVNGDRWPDVVVANNCAPALDCFDGPNTGAVAVLLNRGDGTFRAPASYLSGGASAMSAAVGDMNGDGKPDLIVANNCAIVPNGNCPGGSVAVLLGNGNGKFQAAKATSTPLAIGGGQLAIADFNGDGKLDVASGAAQFLFLGKGDGTLQAPIYLGASGSAIVAGDFNGDGSPDLGVGGLTVLLNRRAAARVTLTSSQNPSNYGQSVTFSATVSGTVGTPTGTVTFTDGTTDLGTVNVDNGTAVLSDAALSAVFNTIGAEYSGDPHYFPSVSSLLQKVRSTNTTTILVSSPNPAALNQPVTYTATVISKNGGAVSGNVIFKDNSKVTTVPLNGGVAALTETYSAMGAHLVTATYSGDDNNSASVSGLLKQFVEVLPVVSKTAVKSSGSPSRIDLPVTFTASVTSFFGKIPDGETITFFDGSTPIGTGSTMGGVATFTTSSLSVKAHTVKATYAGDSTFAASSGTAQQVVSLYQSSTKFSVTPNPSNLGESVTLTATVSSGAPGGNTGQVTFRDGATVLGTASVTNDVATLITSALPQGSILLTANYKGDTLSLPSSGTTTQTVH